MSIALSIIEYTICDKKITLFFNVLERKGVWGKEKLLSRSFLSPINY